MSTTLYDSRVRGSRGNTTLNAWLWVAQVILAVFFLLAGGTHAFMPIEQAAKIAPWIGTAPVVLVRFIGLVELAGAFGVILPAATRVMPWLTPLAAAGLALIMVLAMPVHVMRGEVGEISHNVVALLVAAFIAWGRTTRVCIKPRAAE